MEEYDDDGFIGDGPVTNEDEAVCGRTSDPFLLVTEVLNNEDQFPIKLIYIE